jgi:hypothetical protein
MPGCLATCTIFPVLRLISVQQRMPKQHCLLSQAKGTCVCFLPAAGRAEGGESLSREASEHAHHPGRPDAVQGGVTRGSHAGEGEKQRWAAETVCQT